MFAVCSSVEAMDGSCLSVDNAHMAVLYASTVAGSI